MIGPAEELERRIDGLRAAVRQSIMAGDRVRAAALRRDLRAAEHEWEMELAGLEATAPAAIPNSRVEAALVPVREQVHHALTLLAVPAAPKLVGEVHRAFFAADISGARMTSLRRDEERSFRQAPYSRPYYLCPALNADLLSPARGLLAVSTWPLERRVVGPLSQRVDFLTGAINVAERVRRLPDTGAHAIRLLWRFAANIPGVAGEFGAVRPEAVVAAARAELEIHEAADGATRSAAASRAQAQLDDAGRLFGAAKLRALPRTAKA
jgi:hypothetical protein